MIGTRQIAAMLAILLTGGLSSNQVASAQWTFHAGVWGPGWHGGAPGWVGGWRGTVWGGSGFGRFGYANPYWANPGWGFDPYCGGLYAGYWGPPPVIIPAETLYGPLAVRRFMGLDPGLGSTTVVINNYAASANNFGPPLGLQPGPAIGLAGQPPLAQPAAAAPAPLLPPVALPERQRANVRPSNAEARARAWHMVGFGDQKFRRQQFAAAADRYRAAANAAPDLPEVHFRQAVCRFAVGQYESALRSLKFGLELHDEARPLEIPLADLYAENPVARDAHLDRLAETIEAQPPQADLLLLLGTVLHGLGQTDRALPLLQRARQLEVDDPFHVELVLKTAQPAQPQQVVANKGDQ